MSLSLGDEFEWELLNSEPSDMSAGFLLPCLLTNYETIRRNTSGEGMGVERQKRARTEDRRCAVRDLGCPFDLQEPWRMVLLPLDLSNPIYKTGSKSAFMVCYKG